MHLTTVCYRHCVAWKCNGVCQKVEKHLTFLLLLLQARFLFPGSFLTQYSYHLYFFFTFVSDGGSLRPSTRKVLSLAAKARTLQQDKEHLRINLTRAEEEVKLLFEENNILDGENKRLLRREHREQNFDGSGGKHSSSASAKRSKRKSSSRSFPVESKIDSEDIDSLRQPLSPLRHNSPGCRLYKQ